MKLCCNAVRNYFHIILICSYLWTKWVDSETHTDINATARHAQGTGSALPKYSNNPPTVSQYSITTIKLITKTYQNPSISLIQQILIHSLNHHILADTVLHVHRCAQHSQSSSTASSVRSCMLKLIHSLSRHLRAVAHIQNL